MAKPRKQKLKVFRTPIGFHDAYVAAPSRKAALEAWGSGTDLFAAGIAEQVTDEKLMKEALQRPGEVVRRSRSSEESHGVSAAKEPTKSRKGKSGGKARKPSRAALDRAEAALAELERKQAAERGELEREEQALERKRRAAEEMRAQALERATARRDQADESYSAALAKWQR